MTRPSLKLAVLASIMLPLLLGASQTSAQLTKEKLKNLVDERVDTRLIVSLIDRDCVTFTVDAQTLLELKQYPPEILEAAIKCHSATTHRPLADGGAPANATLTINIDRQGEGSSREPWGIFVPYATEQANTWEGETTGKADANVDLAVLFTLENEDPEKTLERHLRGEKINGRFIAGCVKDTATIVRPSLLIAKWFKQFGCYWSPAEQGLDLEVPPGRYSLRAVTFMKVVDSSFRLGPNWFRVGPIYDAQLRTACPKHSYEASATLTLDSGERRRMAFSIQSENDKRGKVAAVCCEMAFK